VHPGAAAPAPPPPCDPLISSATDLAELICGHAAPDRHRPDSRARANSFAAAKLRLVQRGICGPGRLRIRQSDWDRTATSRRRIQRLPAHGREVPSPLARNIIQTSPLDPTADLAGTLRGFPDRRGLRVVSRPEISQRLQKFALILRRRSSQLVPHRVSDHSRYL